jgi:hypothetical protein
LAPRSESPLSALQRSGRLPGALIFPKLYISVFG